jgi:hypothetical protein
MTYGVEGLVLNLAVIPNCTYALKSPKLNEKNTHEEKCSTKALNHTKGCKTKMLTIHLHCC